MKKYILLLFGGLLNGLAFAQQSPTLSSPALPLLNGQLSEQFWSRAGNTNINGSNNIFGTLWNSPIYTQTNGAYRMKLNGTFSGGGQYLINGFNAASGVNTSGYLLLGRSMAIQNTTNNIYSTRGAFSLLHLNGEGDAVQELGYRPWMKTGITFTGNNDLSYFGLRQVFYGDSVKDRTETVIAWTDNQTNISDELVFRFIGQNIGGPGMSNNPSSNLISPDDMDGLHIARFTPLGRMGLGNTFGHIDDQQGVAYNTPRSLLHLSYQFREGSANEAYGFMQITYRSPFPNGINPIIGQGETANDGLRLGIGNVPIGSGGSSAYLNSYLRWQEQSSFIIQTESTTDNNVNNDERIRVTSIGALNANFGSNYLGNIGVDNRTRIGISSNGALPVQRPMSLLHLGFDAPAVSGWRDWMDIGSYMTNGNDNMYVGLMRVSLDANNERYDAVINWGDDLSANPNSNFGPDNLRFMFTSDGTGGGPAAGAVGLEGARMTPSANGVLTGFGGTAVTNPYVGGGENATATVEINGWGTASNVNGGNSGLRFTNLNTTSIPVVNPGQGFLTVNASGDVIYTTASAVMGAGCSAPFTEGRLTQNTRLNLSNNNYYFTNLTTAVNPTFNKVAVGYNCGASLPAKFNVFQQEATPINFITWGAYVQNRDAGSVINLDYVGIKAVCNGVQTIVRNTNTGGEFSAFNAQRNIGVYGTAYPGSWTSTTQPPNNYGGYFVAAPLGSTGNSWGIYANGGADAPNTRAGYFAGRIEATNHPLSSSDQQFKDSVKAIDGGLKTITQLKPVKYKFDIAGYPQFNFGAEQQYGFIAQEVQNVLPALVHDSYLPAQLDSLGDTISPEVYYKSLDYTAFIPINTQAIIELNQKVDRATLSDQSIKTNVQDLSGSLDKVLEMRGVSYDWVHTVHPELNLDSANHVGFIAQEIQQVDPRLTYVADDSLLHVEYDKVVPILAEAIQELNEEVENKDSIINVLITENDSQQTTIDAQQGTIDDLNARLTNLENCLSALLPTLCSMNHSLVHNNTPSQQEEVRKNLSVVLNNRSAIILDQNVPNPFAEQTVINFSIPSTVVKAQIHFYDGNGKLMQSVDVTERGLGSLTVFGSDLSTGVYTYTLVADGQIVATKKMMKQ